MKTTLTQWSRRLTQYRVYSNAFALMVSAAGSGILGLMYWDLAAHTSNQKSVGRAAGEIAAITLLSSLSQLSFGTVYQRFLPRAAEKSPRLVLIGYVVSVCVALLLASGYLALGFAHRFFAPTLGWSLLFVFTVLVYTVFALQDSVLISLRVSRWVAVENNLFGVVKLLLLFPLAAYALGQGIVITWTIPLVITTIAVNWYIFRRRLPDHVRTSKITEPLPTFRHMMALSIPQYSTSLLSIVSTSIVTLVVIAKRGAIENAHYFLVAQVAAAPTLFLWSIMKLFLVEAMHEPDDQRRQAFQSVTAMFAICVVSMGLGIPFAHQILSVFGSAYARQGTTLLRLLLFALPGTAVAATYAALAWIDGKIWYLTIREVSTIVVYLAIVLLLINRYGINAVGYAALTTSALEFLLFLPITVRRLRTISRKVSEGATT